MNEVEAKEACALLASEHPDRHTHRWMPTKRDGEWVGAPYVPGTLVINIGDLFQRWTNDVYSSNMHRVKNK